jgi:UDP-N-acetylglucosamine enolpyruvyl transferase
VIAALADKNTLHIIRWTGRVRLHAGAISYCGLEVDAAHGVIQVPEAVFDNGASFSFDGTSLKACSRCRMAASAAIG